PYLLQGVFRAGLAGLAFGVALPVAFVVSGLAGLVLERTLIRRMCGRPLDTLLVAWGISLVLQQLARDLFCAPNVQVIAPSWFQGALSVGPLSLSYARLAIITLVAIIVIIVAVYLARLPHGRRMRAVMQNRQLAGCSGIDTDRVDQLTFFVGSGLAGVAGVALTLLGPIGPGIGTFYIFDAFLVVIVGGLGQLHGAVIVALFLGLLNSFLEYGTNASLAKVLVFAAIVVFLQFRPQGLVALGTRALT
ncbi:MAG: urea ABC transporter permease subunit UrtB, partial [Actinomycetota bacterium]|nr:urea ABC transporter permease subunit UrtB [Actinomycetota bacterium]